MQKSVFVCILLYCFGASLTIIGEERNIPRSFKRGSIIRKVNVKRPEKGKIKINGVLFLADTYPGEDYKNTSGINILKLEHKVNVKHCTIDSKICTHDRPSWKSRKLPCTCYDRLKEAIIELINYAQNALNMVTALGSLSNHTFSNSLRFGSAEVDLNVVRDDIEKKYDACTEFDDREEEYDEEEQRKLAAPSKIPLLNVFPKDAPPLSRRRRDDDAPYIFGPEHTEVFKIRTRRGGDAAPFPNRLEKPTTIFDLLDIMSVIQKSLLGEESDLSQYNDEFPPIHPNYQRRVKTPGLFEVVQKTLYSVLETTDLGFLMVVIGGNMSDIAFPYSSLVQSIKHVMENTSGNDTLIVLTGTCPNRPDVSDPIPCEEMSKYTMPVFATGPDNGYLSQCNELYDVPIMIKDILKKRYFNGGNKAAWPLTKPKKKRGVLMENKGQNWEQTWMRYSHDTSSKMAKSFVLVLIETILVVSFGIAVI